MAFRIQRARGSLPIPRRISADTGGALVAQAVAGFGGAIADLGTKYDIMQAETELSEAKRKSSEEINRLAISYRTNLDPDTYQSEYEKSQATIKSYTPNNRRAARVYGQWLNTRTPGWQDAVDDSREARIDDNFKAEGWKLQQTAVEEGNFTKYRLHLWKGQKLGAYSAEEAAKFLSFGLDARERFVKSEAVRIKAQTKEEYDAYVEQIEQAWLVKLRSKELTENDVMNSTLEVDKKQEWLGYVDKQAEEVLSGEEVITDEEVKGSLEKSAYDIWSGAVSVEDFYKFLKIARYEDKTIDDDAYDELLSLAQREYKSYQAQAMSDAVTEAKNQLVDFVTETALERRMAAVEKRLKGKELEKEQGRISTRRQVQLATWGRYRRALKQLLQKNPDWNHDDIYIESQKLLSTFRNPISDTITLPASLTSEVKASIGSRVNKSDTEKEAKARTTIYDMWNSFTLPTQDKIIQGYKLGESLTEIMKDKDVKDEVEQAIANPNKLPSPKTTREYDLLPSGTRYLHYDGSIKVKR